VVDENGQNVWTGEYLPFGEVAITAQTVENDFRFPGQSFDYETGLHHNWYRYYDPKTGRYISADPLGIDGGINVYAYVVGDPINRVDPEGLLGYADPNWDYRKGEKHNSGPILNFKIPERGPFGKKCGAEGSYGATWIPDITPRACQEHDDCYDQCAMNCSGMWCKSMCDLKLGVSNSPYGGATLYFGKDAYESAKEKYGCNECKE
jgi:RHS repeat-associated protein